MPIPPAIRQGFVDLLSNMHAQAVEICTDFSGRDRNEAADAVAALASQLAALNLIVIELLKES